MGPARPEPPPWIVPGGRGPARRLGSGRGAPPAGSGLRARPGATEAWQRPGDRGPAPRLGRRMAPQGGGDAAPEPRSGSAPRPAQAALRLALRSSDPATAVVVAAATASRPSLPRASLPGSGAAVASSPDATPLSGATTGDHPAGPRRPGSGAPRPGFGGRRLPQQQRPRRFRAGPGGTQAGTATTTTTTPTTSTSTATTTVAVTTTSVVTLDFEPSARRSYSRRVGADLDAGRGSRLDVGLDFKSRFGCHIAGCCGHYHGGLGPGQVAPVGLLGTA